MYEYELKLMYDEYGWVEGELKKVNLDKTATFRNWDDLETFVGCYVDAFGDITVKIKQKEVLVDG